MTWDRYGGSHGWHLDHIKPLASFDLTNPSNQKAACHYTNIQPLPASQNLNKKNRYNPEQDPRTWTGTEWSWGNTTRRILLFN